MNPRVAKLISIEAPWLFQTGWDQSLLLDELNWLTSAHGFSICSLQGSKMTAVPAMFEEFARGLEFPTYFGHNSAAFNDCLTDLSWLEASGFCVVVIGANELLHDEKHEVGWLLGLLSDACEEWSQPVEEGEAWDRSAIPFHVLFHAAAVSSESLPPEIAALPVL